MTSQPPPLPPTPKTADLNRRAKIAAGFAAIPCIIICVGLILRLCGLLRPFHIPTGAMAPAVSAGDYVLMEGFTYRSREPKRGDVIVFKTDGIPMLLQGIFYVKRVVGEPGDRVRLTDGKVFINGNEVTLTNEMGTIVYELPPGPMANSATTALTVPPDTYFVLGDNSTNSLDSRFWGPVPRGNIIGRVNYRYWPPARAGEVK